jgi:hypothetical protein
VISVAVSTDETGLALVKAAGAGRQSLWIGELSGAGRVVKSGRVISRPTWGAGQDAVLVAIDGVLHEVSMTGEVARVSFAQAASAGPVRAVRLSLDGTRLALVAGDGAQAKAYVGLIQQAQDGSPPVLRDVREVHAPLAKVQNAPLMAKVQDIGWSGPAVVAVAGQEANSEPTVREISVDGGLETGSARTGLRPGPVTLAVTPLTGSPQVRYVESGRQLYQGGVRTWTPFSDIPDVQSPCYPG